MEKIRLEQVSEVMGTSKQEQPTGPGMGIEQEAETVNYIYTFNLTFAEHAARFFTSLENALREFKKAVHNELRILTRHGRVSVFWDTEVTPQTPVEYTTCHSPVNCEFSRLETIQKVTVYNEHDREIDLFQLIRIKTND